MPVTMNQAALREIFHKYCEVSQVIIKKGNAQGHFDKFCYGFVTMNVPEKDAPEVMSRITQDNPAWKLKIKEDGPGDNPRPEKFNRPSNYPPQQGFQPNMYHMHQPPQMQQPPLMTMPPTHQVLPSHQSQQTYNRIQGYNNYTTPQQPQNDKGQIYGEKKNRIMVRQLWLGGIPQMIDHSKMTQVMSKFGLVEATEIFPKFAFVKYKKAIDAAIAYERAQIIYQIFGKNSGFRISFSDPSRRKQIVGNNYQFQKSGVMLPILFLGFPPITSANVDINHMLNVCEKYGTIINYFLKKSTNTQMRSYFLFTYDNLKNAMRAKNQLCRRKDLLGQKRVQITLLLDEDSVIKGRDFNNTQQKFINDSGFDKFKKPSSQKVSFNQQQSTPAYGNIYQPPLMPGNYQNYIMPQNNPISTGGFAYNPYNQQATSNYQSPNMGGYFYPPPQGYEGTKDLQKNVEKQSNDVFNLLQSMYDDTTEEKKKGPQKKANDKEQNTHDIISKMLGKDKKKSEEDENEAKQDDHKDKEPSWSGFLTWRGSRKAGVDAYAISQSDFSDYSININSVLNNQDIIVKDKANLMILEPTSNIYQSVFNEYVKVFKRKTGISVTKNWLIYIMGKNAQSDTIIPIKENQLLVVMEKASISQLLKDKIQPCNDSYFE